MKEIQCRKLFRMTIVLIFIFVCLFTALSINKLISHRDYVIRTQTSKLETLNSLAASSMKDYFGKIELSLKTADFWLTKNVNADPRFNKDFIELINILKRDMSGNVDIRLVSKDGNLFYIPSVSSNPLADVHDRKYYTIQQNAETKGFYISDPVLSRVTGKWGIPISYPLSSENFNISIIFAAIEIPTLEKIFEPYQMKQNGSSILVRADGIVLATTPFNNDLIGKSMANYKLWDEFLKEEGSKQIIHETNEIDGINRYITCSKVYGFPVYVISTCEKDSVLEPWTQTLKSNVFFIILLIVVFALLTVIMYRILKKLDDALYEIRNISNTDHLTGLYNRRFFSVQLQHELLRAERYEGKFALAVMDIDKFKSVNDTLGHETGDYLLKALSKLLIENTRKSDIVARWGGEEFVLLLTNTDLEQAIIVLEKLRNLIESTDFKSVGHITSSFGVAEFHPGETLESLISRADELLYISKNSGRNCVTSEKQIVEPDFY